MAKFFYKYMPVRNDFFKNLMLRATPLKCLNDPFEGNFNEFQLKNADDDINSFGAEHGLVCNNLFDNDLDSIMECTQADFNSIGVLSFSENYTNSVMWTYYADEHRGIVIEFDYDKPLFQDSIRKLNGRDSRFGKDYLGLTYEFPQKVIYKKENEIPTFSQLGEARPDSIHEYPWIKFNTLVFIKTFSWSHEKELRSTVPLFEADSVICQPSEHLFKILSSHKEITYKEITYNDLDSYKKKLKLFFLRSLKYIRKWDDRKFQIIFPNEFEMHEEMGDQSIKDEIMFTINNDFDTNIYLFRINPQAITRIFCGCRCDYKKVISLVKENEKLTHLQKNIFLMNKNRCTYQLEPVCIR